MFDTHIDPLKLYFGYDYHVTDTITIYQPTIGKIIEFGEDRMWASINPFITNPTSMRLELWDKGIDWNKLTDYELFLILMIDINKEDTSLIFGDFDFSKLVVKKDSDGEFVFVDRNDIVVIDDFVYSRISEYLRNMFNIHPKVEKARGKFTKEAMIDEDRMKKKMAERNKENEESSFLLPLISSLVNHPGFKYKKSELVDVGIVEFMDSVQRLQIYEQSTAFLKGMYSGFMDTSKISKSELDKNVNWLRDLQNK